MFLMCRIDSTRVISRARASSVEDASASHGPVATRKPRTRDSSIIMCAGRLCWLEPSAPSTADVPARYKQNCKPDRQIPSLPYRRAQITFLAIHGNIRSRLSTIHATSILPTLKSPTINSKCNCRCTMTFGSLALQCTLCARWVVCCLYVGHNGT
jgi:hypothetical protein